MNVPGRVAALVLGIAATGVAGPYRAYIGELSQDTVLIAWGTMKGKNGIGRESKVISGVSLSIDGREVPKTSKNWYRATGLQPNSAHTYVVRFPDQTQEEGSFRTWPQRANSLAFLVIGDFGNGGQDQHDLAKQMAKVVAARAGGARPIRFVLTTGDNLYGKGVAPLLKDSGRSDDDWDSRFFTPYKGVISSIPFYASPGNHDGNESDHRADLTTYLDNFYFPNNAPRRYYHFNYAGFADFFSLDSTRNTLKGKKAPFYLEEGDQSKWLKAELAKSQAQWKIAYFHHPPFTAGPEHPPALPWLSHWVKWFNEAGVQAAFSGHEHNFQVAKRNEAAPRTRYFVTGAGGQLRAEDVRGAMADRNIEAWTPVHHFLVVDIDGNRMSVTPVAMDGNPPRMASPEGYSLPVQIDALPQ